MKPLPDWEKSDERFQSLVNDIRWRGIDLPLLIDGEGRILDGRKRCRAAKQLQLEAIECRAVPSNEIASTILGNLVQRAHFTKGALAYVAFPLLEPAHQEALRRKLEYLKNPNKSQSLTQFTIGKTVEEFCCEIGFTKPLFYQAKEVHGLFSKHPKLKPEFEPKILSGEIGLGAAIAGMGSSLSTRDQAKNNRRQLELFEDALDTCTVRFAYWNRFTDQERAEAREAIQKNVSSMPAGLRAEWKTAIKEADSK